MVSASFLLPDIFTTCFTTFIPDTLAAVCTLLSHSLEDSDEPTYPVFHPWHNWKGRLQLRHVSLHCVEAKKGEMGPLGAFGLYLNWKAQPLDS